MIVRDVRKGESYILRIKRYSLKDAILNIITRRDSRSMTQ